MVCWHLRPVDGGLESTNWPRRDDSRLKTYRWQHICVRLYCEVLILCVQAADVWIWCQVFGQGRRCFSLCELCPRKWSTIRAGWTSRGTHWSRWARKQHCSIAPQHNQCVFHLVCMCMHACLCALSHQACATRTTGSALSAQWLRKEYRSKKKNKTLHALLTNSALNRLTQIIWISPALH